MRLEADAAVYLHVVQSAEEKTQAKAWDDAVALWARAVAINPTQGLAWVRLGQAHYHVGQYRQAILAFEKTLELGAFPDLHDHEYNYRWRVAYDIARCYALLNDHKPAMAWLERSLALGYRDRGMIQHDDAFRSLRNDSRFHELVGVTDVTHMSRDAGWQYDLAFLVREIKRIHYAPFQHTAEDAFDHLAQHLHESIPTLADDQIIVALMRLVAALGDAHSTVALWELGERLPDAPVEFYLFAEGVFITAAGPPYRDVVGAQVLALGDHPVEQVIMALAEIVSRDNPLWIQQSAPGLMRKPCILHAMGLTPDASVLPVTMRDAKGTISTVHIAADRGPVPDPLPEDWPAVVKQSGGPLPLYLKEAGHYWFEYLPDDHVLYFHYRTVRDHQDEPFDRFCDRLIACLNTNQVDKFVIDMRRNGGGNTFLHFPLFRAIARSEKLRQGSTLFVIIGRQTFSAAMNLVAYLESRCFEWGIPLIFVGEPTGSSPNFVGETVIVRLPYSNLPVSISDLYWQTSWPEDGRIWLPPHIYTPPTFAALQMGTDPALDAIFQYADARGVDQGNSSPPTTSDEQGAK